MKSMIKSITLLALLFVAGSTFAQEESNELWVYNSTDWDKILKQAQTDDNYIVVDCYTDWCSWCKWMDKNTLVDFDVANEMNGKYLFVKLNMEKEGEWMAEKYDVTAFPTFMYFDPSGQNVHRVAGAMNPLEFVTEAMVAENPEERLLEKTQTWENGLDELGTDELVPFLYDYTWALDKAGLYTEAAVVATEYLEETYASKWQNEQGWNMVSSYLTNTGHDYFTDALKLGDDFVKNDLATQDDFNAYVERAFTSDFKHYAKEDDLDGFTMTLNMAKEYLPGMYAMLMAKGNYIFHNEGEKAHTMAQIYLNNYCKSWQELNSAAWNYYLNVSDEQKLNDAIGWAQTSVSLDKNFYNGDTLAHLLYKVGRYQEAKKSAEKAIEYGEKEGMDVSDTEELLQEINSAMK